MSVKVKLAHLRSAPGLNGRPGYCVQGAQAIAKRHGLDWRRFCREGLDEEELLATGDAFAILLVEHARSLVKE